MTSITQIEVDFKIVELDSGDNILVRLYQSIPERNEIMTEQTDRNDKGNSWGGDSIPFEGEMTVIKWSDGSYTVDGEFVEADKLGAWQVAFYDQLAATQAKPRKPRKKSNRRSTAGRPSKRTNYAAQVLKQGYAMAELVERVNEDE
jgi:hypothetical protein